MAIVYRFVLFVFCTAWLIPGCAAEVPSTDQVQTIPVKVLYYDSECGGPGAAASAVWIARPEALPKMPRHTIGGPGSGTIRWDPAVDGAVWLQMGRQPTGGYGLTLPVPTARVVDGVAHVGIQWREPSPELIVPQVLTSPCMVFSLPRAGLRAVHIEDQNGTVRAKVSLP